MYEIVIYKRIYSDPVIRILLNLFLLSVKHCDFSCVDAVSTRLGLVLLGACLLHSTGDFAGI